ncbi:MAG: 16S rRNA (guanine(966)-N(2))-methyltransferase RsmD [Lentisphaerae bacterium]|jgi:16S rRNA (guanine966-N2)-methyltransferase|nr:16S rRNA (guanine(966)-N(2))-methyltransferase RsmD [Lentisphaerota bacterium]
MRIISGKARSIRLQAPPGSGLRPTEDRVKEALFAILGDLRDKNVLDLFAGSGALGLEALSRGAGTVFMLEKNPAHVLCMEKNLAAVRKAIGPDCGQVKIVTADAQHTSRVLSDWSGKFAVILADPPYNPPPGAFGGAALLQQPEFAAWAGTDCLLVLEHQYGEELPLFPHSPWHLLRQKRFGIRALSFLSQKNEPS